MKSDKRHHTVHNNQYNNTLNNQAVTPSHDTSNEGTENADSGATLNDASKSRSPTNNRKSDQATTTLTTQTYEKTNLSDKSVTIKINSELTKTYCYTRTNTMASEEESSRQHSLTPSDNAEQTFKSGLEASKTEQGNKRSSTSPLSVVSGMISPPRSERQICQVRGGTKLLTRINGAAKVLFRRNAQATVELKQHTPKTTVLHRPIRTPSCISLTTAQNHPPQPLTPYLQAFSRRRQHYGRQVPIRDSNSSGEGGKRARGQGDACQRKADGGDGEIGGGSANGCGAAGGGGGGGKGDGRDDRSSEGEDEEEEEEEEEEESSDTEEENEQCDSGLGGMLETPFTHAVICSDSTTSNNDELVVPPPPVPPENLQQPRATVEIPPPLPYPPPTLQSAVQPFLATCPTLPPLDPSSTPSETDGHDSAISSDDEPPTDQLVPQPQVPDNKPPQGADLDPEQEERDDPIPFLALADNSNLPLQ